MHQHEFPIDKTIVQRLLINQCPQWAHLHIEAIQTNGTDNALYRLGDEYIVRLPRIEWSLSSIQRNIDKEWLWLPKIAGFLSMPISAPLFLGKPDAFYPWPWTIAKWFPGKNPNFELHNEYEILALQLANFLNEFHAIELLNGPPCRRGIALTSMINETNSAIDQLTNEVDRQLLINTWQNLIKIPLKDNKPVWLHGDFLPGNIIIENNQLVAVIDFSDVGMGDAACDLIIAWSLFNSHSRNIFKNHLINIDEATWQRGRGFALAIATIMLPYYKDKNLYLTTLAKRMIENVLY